MWAVQKVEESNLTKANEGAREKERDRDTERSREWREKGGE